MMEATPLARVEFESLLDIRTTTQALRWALRNGKRARKREQHVLLLLVEEVADLTPRERLVGLTTDPDADDAFVLAGRLVVAWAEREPVSPLVDEWVAFEVRDRVRVLALLLGDLIGSRLDDDFVLPEDGPDPT